MIMKNGSLLVYLSAVKFAVDIVISNSKLMK